MRPNALSLCAGLLLLSASWALIAPTESRANQHAPIVSFDELIAPVEILAGRMRGESTFQQPVVFELHQVPADRTLVITDIQVRANGISPMLLRDGLPVAEATLASNDAGVTPNFVAGHTSIAAGVEFGPGTRLQLSLRNGSWTEFVALRGYYKTIGVPVITIQAGDAGR